MNNSEQDRSIADVRVRLATLEDYAGFVVVAGETHAHHVAAVPGIFRSVAVAVPEEYFAQLVTGDDSDVIVAEVSGEIVGYAVLLHRRAARDMLVPRAYAHIENFGVAATYRREGIGRQLIEACVARAKERAPPAWSWTAGRQTGRRWLSTHPSACASRAAILPWTSEAGTDGRCSISRNGALPGYGARKTAQRDPDIIQLPLILTQRQRALTHALPQRSFRCERDRPRLRTSCRSASSPCRLRSYFGQPGSPLVAKATQAACMVSASCCGGLVPSSGSVPLPSVSKTKGISSAWHAPRRPLNCGERQANSYM